MIIIIIAPSLLSPIYIRTKPIQSLSSIHSLHLINHASFPIQHLSQLFCHLSLILIILIEHILNSCQLIPCLAITHDRNYMLQGSFPKAVILSLYCTMIIDVESEEQIYFPQALSIIVHGKQQLNNTLRNTGIRTLSSAFRLFQDFTSVIQHS